MSVLPECIRGLLQPDHDSLIHNLLTAAEEILEASGELRAALNDLRDAEHTLLTLIDHTTAIPSTGYEENPQ
ncbi:MAG: hypothetical protein KL863_28450 [Rhizobium sp.]|nr:hypothetical protein [Rhizobium sp.]